MLICVTIVQECDATKLLKELKLVTKNLIPLVFKYFLMVNANQFILNKILLYDSRKKRYERFQKKFYPQCWPC